MSSTSTSNFLGVQLSVLKYCNIFYQEGKKKRKRYDQIHLELRKKIDIYFVLSEADSFGIKKKARNLCFCTKIATI